MQLSFDLCLLLSALSSELELAELAVSRPLSMTIPVERGVDDLLSQNGGKTKVALPVGEIASTQGRPLFYCIILCNNIRSFRYKYKTHELLLTVTNPNGIILKLNKSESLPASLQ